VVEVQHILVEILVAPQLVILVVVQLFHPLPQQVVEEVELVHKLVLMEVLVVEQVEEIKDL
jgi:hypothetical protein